MNEELMNLEIEEEATEVGVEDDTGNEVVVTETETEDVEVAETSDGVGDTISHDTLSNLSKADQHPIDAIINLKKELSGLEKLKTVYSDKHGMADYYKWANNAVSSATGHFVSMVDGSAEIEICNGEKPILGVTVPCAGFVGNQEEIESENNDEYPFYHIRTRGEAYALVATSGVVDVRSESGVIVGDCVVSDVSGYAKKTETGFGYRVIAVDTEHEDLYVTISLDVQGDVVDAIGGHISYLTGEMNKANINIAAAMAAATEAYSKANESCDHADNVAGSMSGVQDKFENIDSEIEHIQGKLDQISTDADEKINEAVKEAKEDAQAAVDTANAAMAGVESLKKSIAPLDTWVNPDNPEEKGAEYYIKYMDDQGVKTKAHIDELDTVTQEHNSAIKKNAKSIQSTVSYIDKYAVGKYSQAYGLSLAQARTILEDGMMFVPVGESSWTEKYKYPVETKENGEIVYANVQAEFTPGYTYVWEWYNNEDDRTVERVDHWNANEAVDGMFYYVNDTKTYWYQKDGVWTETDDSHELGTLDGYIWKGHTDMRVWQNGYPPAEGSYGLWFNTGIIVVDDGNKLATWDSEGKDQTEVYYAEDTKLYYFYCDGEWHTDKDYNADTLYIEDDGWLAVATLVGNYRNRSISVLSQTADSISMELVATNGAVASIREDFDDLNGRIDLETGTTWPIGADEYFMTLINQSSGEHGSTVELAAMNRGGTEKTVLNGASIVLSTDGSDSYISLDADTINFDTSEFAVKDSANGDKVLLRAGNNQVNVGGFTVGDSSIYNEHTRQVAGVIMDYHMTSPSTINTNLYMTDAESEFVYVGTDGVGTFKVDGADGLTSVNATTLNTYMSKGHLYSNSAEITGKITATSGEFNNVNINTGNFAGFKLGTGAMSLGNIGESQSVWFGGTASYGTATVANRMAGDWRLAIGSNFGVTDTGNLYAASAQINSGRIGSAKNYFTIAANGDNTALYSKTASLPTFMTGLTENDVYFGTDGMLLKSSDAGYNTMIRSNGVVCYGDSGTKKHKASYVTRDRVEFYYTDSVPFETQGFQNAEVGRIGLMSNNPLKMELYAKNDMSITSESGLINISGENINVGVTTKGTLSGSWECEDLTCGKIICDDFTIPNGVLTPSMSVENLDVSDGISIGSGVTLKNVAVDTYRVAVMSVVIDGTTYNVVVEKDAATSSARLEIERVYN